MNSQVFFPHKVLLGAFMLSQQQSRAAVSAHVAPSSGVEGATAHGNHMILRRANEGVGRQTPKGGVRIPGSERKGMVKNIDVRALWL